MNSLVSLSQLSFAPKRKHFPICCSKTDKERLLVRKRDEAEKFYSNNKLDLLSSKERKELVPTWINKNIVLEDHEKKKKVKNKMLKKKKTRKFDEIEFGDVLGKGKSDLINFMLCGIKAQEDNTEDKEKKKKEEEEKKKEEEEKKKSEEEEKAREEEESAKEEEEKAREDKESSV